jgi:hypothetical protein
MLSCLPPRSLSPIQPSEVPYLLYKSSLTNHSHVPAPIQCPKVQARMFLWQNCWLSQKGNRGHTLTHCAAQKGPACDGGGDGD